MKAIVVKDCHYSFNDYDYQKDDTVEVFELEQYKDDYVIYYEETMDWIPKTSVKIIE